MTALSIPWRFLLFSIFVAFISLVTYDITIHGNLKKSETGKYLKNAGLLEHTEEVVKQSTFYFNKAYSWSSTNIPLYTNQFVTVVSPYVSHITQALYDLSLLIWSYMGPLRDYLNQNVPILLEWLNENVPIALERVTYYAKLYGNQIYVFVREYSILVWEFICEYAIMVNNWLRTTVFTGQLSPDKIQEATWKAYDAVHHYSVAAYDWVQQQFLGTAAMGK
jgi:hypothetical protein